MTAGIRKVSPMRSPRAISERELAIALVLELAQFRRTKFSLMGFYDNDIEFVADLATRLGIDTTRHDKPFRAKLARVTRHLVRSGVLYGRMLPTRSEYMGEPHKQMEYGFADYGKVRLLTAGPTEHIGTPEWEASFLLRRAYPAAEPVS